MIEFLHLPLEFPLARQARLMLVHEVCQIGQDGDGCGRVILGQSLNGKADRPEPYARTP